MGKINLSLDEKDVKGVSMSKSVQGGYSYASMYAQPTEDMYVSYSVEWKGEDVPEVALAMVKLMTTVNKKAKASKEEIADAVDEFKVRLIASMEPK